MSDLPRRMRCVLKPRSHVNYRSALKVESIDRAKPSQAAIHVSCADSLTSSPSAPQSSLHQPQSSQAGTPSATPSSPVSCSFLPRLATLQRACSALYIPVILAISSRLSSTDLLLGVLSKWRTTKSMEVNVRGGRGRGRDVLWSRARFSRSRWACRRVLWGYSSQQVPG
jgi:hypothetical protein